MRTFLTIMAFSFFIAPVASKADIIVVNKSKSHTATVFSGAPARCSDGPLIIRVGKPERSDPCPAKVQKPEFHHHTDIVVVFLAEQGRGHYRHHGHHGRKD